MMPLLIPNKQVLNLAEPIKTATATALAESDSPEKNIKNDKNALETSTHKNVNALRPFVNNPTYPSNLPPAMRQALNHITQSLTRQQPLATLLGEANRAGVSLPNIDQPHTEAHTEAHTAEHDVESLLSHLFRHAVRLNGDKSTLAGQLSSAIQHYNAGISDKETESSEDWREQLAELLEAIPEAEEEPEDALLELARGWLMRSGHNAFMQQLQLNAGNAVLLQDIPIYHHQWQGVHLEIERTPNPDQEAYEWKVLIQFPLDDTTTITSKLVLNAQQEIQVYLWADDPNTTHALQQHAPTLSRSLYELGLLPQTMVIAVGKPPCGKDTHRPSALAGCVNVRT